jgi:hypothetical protein
VWLEDSLEKVLFMEEVQVEDGVIVFTPQGFPAG